MLLRWYVVAGTLLFFNLYPRMDSMHVIFSAPLLFVVGAFALSRMYKWLAGRPTIATGRPIYCSVLYAAFLILPVAAALPSLEWRVRAFIVPEKGMPTGLADYAPLEEAGANVLLPRDTRDAIANTVDYLQERTAEDEPIFVYPMVPMFYFLAERPNPTRFDHLYPGAATTDEQGEIVEALERQHVRYVIWDQGGVEIWGQNGRIVLNETLTAYLVATFHTDATIGPFTVLKRSE
jgi:hypothetical protein